MSCISWLRVSSLIMSKAVSVLGLIYTQQTKSYWEAGYPWMIMLV